MATKDELIVEQPKSSPIANSYPSSVAFIHNVLDEYGLDSYEFRLYAHIVRRTGGKPEGVCFASLRKTAEICKMSMRKAQQAIKVLIKANLVTQTKRTGRTDEYRVTPVSDWVSKDQLDQIRKTIKTAKDSSADSDLDTEIGIEKE
ncbi:helix-turn-helix domain-containing protein [Nostoc sp.]|uniref:helix-turn-helix domain-containing protein n=1 Tax=Nostoc sp. TaxID=1180 RepID=UPI001DF71C81|nr:helix-turn-helix domain-containing protein [Nostoc sp. HG1]